MYAIVLVRYRVPLEEVMKVTDEHRAYLRELRLQGLLIASGPLDPRSGGALLFRVPDADARATLDRLRDNDPYYKKGIGNYELLLWAPNIGNEALDQLK
jgi:uncharacterized protein YciI